MPVGLIGEKLSGQFAAFTDFAGTKTVIFLKYFNKTAHLFISQHVGHFIYGRKIYFTLNGNIVVGAPVGGSIPNALGLTIQTGNIHVFKRKQSTPSGAVTSDQVLESPRSTSLLQLLGTLDLNVLFGAAYVFRGDGNGGYLPNPVYNMSATHGGELLSVNAVSLFGFSVAGAPRIHGSGTAPRILVGSPAGALDFDNSLLNLDSTVGLLFDFALADNGVGKSYAMYPQLCGVQTLPVTLLDFSAMPNIVFQISSGLVQQKYRRLKY